MKTRFYALIGLIFFVLPSFGQGLNNGQYAFDESDFENISKFYFDIDTYKFFVNAKITEKLDIVFEEYLDQELKDSSKIIGEIIEQVGFDPLDQSFGDEFIRFYIKDNTKEKQEVDLRLNYLSLAAPKKFEKLELKYVQSRAFSDIPTDIEERTPVLAIYGNKDGKYISCPGGAKPEQIVKLYDWVVIVSLEELKESAE